MYILHHSSIARGDKSGQSQSGQDNQRSTSADFVAIQEMVRTVKELEPLTQEIRVIAPRHLESKSPNCRWQI